MPQRIDFTVDGLRYVWSVGADHQIMFWLEESNHKARVLPPDTFWVWGEDDTIVSVGETGVCRRPVALIRQVVKLTVGWIRRARPSYFWLQTPNPRKRCIYRKLVERFGPAHLEGFQVVEYDEAIYFYRETPQPGSTP